MMVLDRYFLLSLSYKRCLGVSPYQAKHRIMIDPHAAMQHQMRMKILIQESISPDTQRKMKNKKDYTEEIATTSKNEVSQ